MSNFEELIKFAEQNHAAENCCIVEDKYKLSAESFEKVGNLYTTNDDKYAARIYIKPVDNYIKDNKDKLAIDLLVIAINLYIEDGKFGTAAIQLEKLADLYLKDNQILLAIENYIKAYKYFCIKC